MTTTAESPPRGSSWPVYCDAHGSRPAIAHCTRCGAFVCRSCRSVDRRGLALCRVCEAAGRPSTVAFEQTQSGLVPRFFSTVRAVLTRPSSFVRDLDLRGALGPAVRFGLTCIIVGQLAAYVWFRLLAADTYAEVIADSAQQMGLSVANLELLFFVVLPLEALLRLGLCGMLLQLGVLLSGAARKYRYRDYVRLFSYASAAYLMLFIPLDMGVLMAFLFVLIICSYGLRVHHDLSGFQTFVATVPLAVGLVLLSLSGTF